MDDEDEALELVDVVEEVLGDVVDVVVTETVELLVVVLELLELVLELLELVAELVVVLVVELDDELVWVVVDEELTVELEAAPPERARYAPAPITITITTAARAITEVLTPRLSLNNIGTFHSFLHLKLFHA